MAEHGRAAQFIHGYARRGAAAAGHLTSRYRMVPDFLIVGGQRCGTTALYKFLVNHPAVLGAGLHKGVHYFDTAYPKGMAWYRGHFPLLTTAAKVERKIGVRPITGEASPYYMFHPAAGARIGADLPEARLVAIVRDPVERAYSAYTHEKARGFETESFEGAIELEAERLDGDDDRLRDDPAFVSPHHQHNAYLARGRYVEQLVCLEQQVGRDRLLVLDFDDLFGDLSASLPPLLDFLGLPAWEQGEIPKKNARPRTRLPGDTRARLEEHFAPYDEKLEAWWGRVPSWRR